MLKINQTKNEVELELNECLYPKDIIKSAINDFRQACEGTMKGKDILIVRLKPKNKEDLGIIGYEFFNYALGLMKNQTVV